MASERKLFSLSPETERATGTEQEIEGGTWRRQKEFWGRVRHGTI